MSREQPDEHPLDTDAIAADDELVEQLRAGETPDGPLGQRLGAFRDETQQP